jgi:HD-GYP domain-containing protein (c-di-GMP phosphodiesterase class II)
MPVKPLVLLAHGRVVGTAPLGRSDAGVELRRVLGLPRAAALDPERPTVILLDRTLLAGAGAGREQLAELARVAAIVGIGNPGELEPPAEFPADLLTSYLPGDAPAALVATQLRGAVRHAAALVAERRARDDEERHHRELVDLSRIGVALSTERDLMTLLEMILSQARGITGSDAGSLYLVERGDDGQPRELRFKFAQNFTLPELPLTAFAVPFDHTSLAGYAASTGEPLVLPDVYLLAEDAPYKLNRSFDEQFGYRTKSMLVIPMRSHRDEVIGVLQLINRKRSPDVRLPSPEIVEQEVLPYDGRSVELVSALASQAGVAIENSLLYEDIERLFEGFVTAAVTAIEQRDPTTSGHSARVATLTVGLAEAVDRGGAGPYKSLRLSRTELREIRYAALLHDFGKVSVREHVLVKEKKLYPWDLDIIRHRFAYQLQALDLQFERERANYLAQHGTAQYEEAVAELDRIRRESKGQLIRFLDAIVSANEPTVLPFGNFDELREINRRRYVDFDGVERRLLRDDELRFLMVRQGNLDDQERREIESHVTHTYRFLAQIPWTRELRRVPDIAYGHHERLNGAGYPRQVHGDEIPVQTRMMTIADVFDALTATDRPYKRAVPWDRALDILADEAKEGMLDGHLLQTFIEARIFELVRSLAPGRDHGGIPASIAVYPKALRGAQTRARGRGDDSVGGE